MRVHESFLSQNIFCDSKKIFCDLSVEMELENEKTTSTRIPNKENKNVDVHFAKKTGKQNWKKKTWHEGVEFHIRNLYWQG